MYRQNKCVYPVLWDLIRKHIWHSYEGQCLLNFHLVCMEDKQALDHLSPMHKAAAEWQKPVELVELHPVLPVLKQYLEFLLSAGTLSTVHGAETVLPHSVSTIQTCQHQGGQIPVYRTSLFNTQQAKSVHAEILMNVQQPLFKPKYARLS